MLPGQGLGVWNFVNFRCYYTWHWVHVVFRISMNIHNNVLKLSLDIKHWLLFFFNCPDEWIFAKMWINIKFNIIDPFKFYIYPFFTVVYYFDRERFHMSLLRFHFSAYNTRLQYYTFSYIVCVEGSGSGSGSVSVSHMDPPQNIPPNTTHSTSNVQSYTFTTKLREQFLKSALCKLIKGKLHRLGYKGSASEIIIS